MITTTDHVTCLYCGAAIVWAKTTIGRSMPINVEPDDTGNVRLVEGPDGYLAIITRPDMIPEGERRRTHFATCPNASEARRNRK